MDKLDDCFKRLPSETALLLMELARRQVSWLPKLPTHNFMGHLIKFMKVGLIFVYDIFFRFSLFGGVYVYDECD